MRACLYPVLALLLGACSAGSAPPGSLQLEQYAGRWVVINYWATWCKPCIQEIPELNALDEQYPQVTVLGVNYDGASGDELTRQAQDLGIAFTMLTTDPATALGVPRPAVLPTTLIIGPDGVLRQTLVGPQTLQSLAAHTSRQNSDG
jgi:thiol-disulfide isomerase/thioredoxin